LISRSLSSHTTISAELHSKVARTCKQITHDNSEILAIRLGVNHSAICASDLYSQDNYGVSNTHKSYCHARVTAAY
jgi:hypothetical protein